MWVLVGKDIGWRQAGAVLRCCAAPMPRRGRGVRPPWSWHGPDAWHGPASQRSIELCTGACGCVLQCEGVVGSWTCCMDVPAEGGVGHPQGSCLLSNAHTHRVAWARACVHHHLLTGQWWAPSGMCCDAVVPHAHAAAVGGSSCVSNAQTRTHLPVWGPSSDRGGAGWQEGLAAAHRWAERPSQARAGTCEGNLRRPAG